VNYLSGATSAIQTQLNTASAGFGTHTSDYTVHLTSTQNTWIDAITATSAEVNYLVGVTSLVQSQLNAIVGVNNTQNTRLSTLETTTVPAVQTNLTNHMNDATVHLTPSQNTWIDAITVTSTEVNYLGGVTSAIQTQLNTLAGASFTQKLSTDGSLSMSGDLSLANHRITNLGTPTVASDAATKDYVDSFVQGLHWVGSCVAATTANIALSGLQTIDGVALAISDRVLVKNQSVPAQNGIYNAASGAWSRANDYNALLEINSSAVFVLNGTSQNKSTWVQISTVITIGTDTISFSAFSGPVVNTAGSGISLGVNGQVSLNQGAGLTFDGNNTLVVDLHSAGGLMVTTDNTSPVTLTTVAAQLALTNSGVTSGTYNNSQTAITPFTVDVKGRITGTGAAVTITPEYSSILNKPTTVSGYGITNAVLKTGDTMTGDLLFSGGTVIRNSAPGASNAWFSTAAYGVSQGDGKTHFGYFDGTQYVNYIRGVTTTASGNLAVSGTLSAGNATSTVVANNFVLRDGNGYTYFNYVNSTDNSQSSGVTGVMVKAGDDFHRTGTAAAVAAFISGQNFNTAGNAATATVASSANSVLWTNVSGRPTNISSFTNDSGYALLTGATFSGDITTYRVGTPTTGVLYLGSNAGTRYLYYDGTQYILNGAGLSVGGTVSANTAGTHTGPVIGNVTGTASAATLADKASTLAMGGGNGTAMTFNWSGQGGQPAWLWGGNDGVNHYVYSPSNFSVSHAATAGSATTATTADTANSVLWTNVSGRPTNVSSFTNDAGYITAGGAAGAYLPLTGGTVTGALGVTDGSTNDPYGRMSVTMSSNANSYGYYGMTRAGQIGWSMGVNTSNQLFFGTGGPGSAVNVTNRVFSLNNGGDLAVSGSISGATALSTGNGAFVVSATGVVTTLNGVSSPNGVIRLTPNLHLNPAGGNAVILAWDNGNGGSASNLALRVGNGSATDVFTVAYNGATVISGAVSAASFNGPGTGLTGTASSLSVGTSTYSTYLWSTSHPGTYYISNAWDNTYWHLTSNHGAPVRVGYADSAGSAGSASTATNSTQLGGVNASGYALLTGAVFSGDITTYRSASPTTGVIFLGNSGSKYLYFDGTNYNLPGGGLIVGGTVSASFSGNLAGTASAATLAAKASTLAQNGGDGAAMTFNYSGQGGQPVYLWGTNDGTNNYVWNPSNFSVSYAATAGTASSASTSSLSSNTNSISNAVNNAYTWGGQQSFISSLNTSNTGASGTLMPQSAGGATAAVISFHRVGAFGLNMGLDNDNVFRIGGWSASANLLQMDMSGNLTMAGDVIAYSDRRLKTDVQPIQDPLQKVQELNGITYKRIDSGEVSTGLIAQDVQAVLPEAVTADINGILAVKYGNLAGLFVEAIKALNKEVAELRAEIKALKDAQ
jgi:hypothetical protein